MSARYDIIVVGGGHAGSEAALAAARLGLRTALITHDRREIGRMPCNPAIGGLGKGHLVREIDVLGGEMGRAIDDTVLHLRVLNRKKGPAVQAPRAQADKHAYQARLATTVGEQPGLSVIEDDCTSLLVAPAPAGRGAPLAVRGVLLGGGGELRGERVVLCSGTFLRGLMHVGETRRVGGREGAASSEGLSAELRRLGFTLNRLKTGTPPRLRAASIDTARLQEQASDPDPLPFSFRTHTLPPPRIVCWLTYTNARTHAIIRENLHRSPLFAGAIEGRGPRYCPSIEDKVVRFADRERHLIFLEPEGLDTDEVYVNGVSTSLPADTQVALIRSIVGLERAELVRHGYAVEYDSVPSWQVRPTLETKPVAGLYLAGQILGTSGYEEAAAQGLVAGVNACRDLTGQDAWLPTRDESYLGVLVDDLVTKEILEPYRMFTSRAEHRLHLRCDNAETRLAPAAAALGLLPASALADLHARNAAVSSVIALLARWRAPQPGGGPTAVDLLRQPGVDLASLRERLPDGPALMVEIENSISNMPVLVARAALAEAAHTIVYSGYISKNDKHLSRQAHLDNLEVPLDFDYAAITALSFEAREKLGRMRPATLGQAARIDGVRAGDLAVLAIHLRRWRSATTAGNTVTTSSPDAALDLARNALRESILRWNPVMNLVSRQDTARQIDRLLDQCQAGFHLLQPVLRELGIPVGGLGYLDVGSGNGLPGLLWSAGWREQGGSGPYWLVEPRQRRAWFLERASRDAAFPPVTVVAGRWGAPLAASSPPDDVLISLKALRLTEPEVLAGLTEGFVGDSAGAQKPQRIVITRFLGPAPGADAGLVQDLQAGGDGGGAAWQQTARRILADPVVRLLVTAYARV